MQHHQVFYSDIGCMHCHLEFYSCQWAYDIGAMRIDGTDCYGPCEDACPNCTGEDKDYKKTVSCLWVSDFLHYLFQTNQHNLGPSGIRGVVEALRDYRNVSKEIYGRPRAKAAPSLYIIETTVKSSGVRS